MDLKKKTNDWLEQGGTYKEGVELYAVCKGRIRHLYNRMKRSQSKWTERKLRSELERLMPLQSPKKKKVVSKPIVKKVVVAPEPTPRTITPNRELPPDNVPKYRKSEIGEIEPFEISEIKRLRNKCYRERDYLHSQLEHYKTDKERYEASKRILLLQKQIKGHWAKLDAYKETGEVPILPEEADLKKEVITKFQRQNNVRSAISQHKSKIRKEENRDTPNMAKIDSWKKQLSKYEAELIELNDFLEL